MGQVTIYLDNELENKMRSAARAGHLSVSKWIAYLIRQKVRTEWPLDVVALAGCWKDDFLTLEEIRSTEAVDLPREEM
ncbi:MAG: CopG family transcriptional regulator [Candidatus Sabulitectum sp.]|nr:CopG family transcriptional regulator [Candidatus Sabulitectum sp.]